MSKKLAQAAFKTFLGLIPGMLLNPGGMDAGYLRILYTQSAFPPLRKQPSGPPNLLKWLAQAAFKDLKVNWSKIGGCLGKGGGQVLKLQPSKKTFDV